MRALTAALALAALLLAASWSTSSAATTGIDITTPLTTQTGTLIFTGAVELTCTVTLTKDLRDELIPVAPEGQLTRLGHIGSGSIGGSALCGFSSFLGLTGTLGEPGPDPESWDISYLHSDQNGNLYFGILDFQVNVAGCLYRGTLLGRMSANGGLLNILGQPALRFESGGIQCSAGLPVRGTLVDAPFVNFTLLTEPERLFVPTST